VGTSSRPGAPRAASLRGSSHKKRHPKQLYLSKTPLNPSFPTSCLTSAKKAIAVTRSLTEQESSHGERFFTRLGEMSPALSRTLRKGHKQGTHSYQGRPQAGSPKLTCTNADAVLQLRMASQAHQKGPSSHFPGHSPTGGSQMHPWGSYLVRRPTPSG